MKIDRQPHEITLHTKWFSVTLSRYRQKRLELQRQGYWKTGSGEIVHVRQMDDKHIMNTIKYIERRIYQEARRYTLPYPEKYPPPRGEYAQELYWRGMAEYDALRELSHAAIVARLFDSQPILKHLWDEVGRRGLLTNQEPRVPDNVGPLKA